MKEKLYKIFDLVTSQRSGDKLVGFCLLFWVISLFLIIFIDGKNPEPLLMIIPLFPILFFITWFILALIVLCIEKLIIAIEFVVYKLGIPKIIINVNVVWKYQQRNADEKQS